MDVTTKLLRQMIKEQMEQQAEPGASSPPSTMRSSEFRAAEKEQAMASQVGLTDEERALLHTLGTKLQRLGATKNLKGAGIVTSLLNRLNTELDKLDLS